MTTWFLYVNQIIYDYMICMWIREDMTTWFVYYLNQINYEYMVCMWNREDMITWFPCELENIWLHDLYVK